MGSLAMTPRSADNAEGELKWIRRHWEHLALNFELEKLQSTAQYLATDSESSDLWK